MVSTDLRQGSPFFCNDRFRWRKSGERCLTRTFATNQVGTVNLVLIYLNCMRRSCTFFACKGLASLGCVEKLPTLHPRCARVICRHECTCESMDCCNKSEVATHCIDLQRLSLVFVFQASACAPPDSMFTRRKNFGSSNGEHVI